MTTVIKLAKLKEVTHDYFVDGEYDYSELLEDFRAIDQTEFE